jgi:hypothetical protein
VIAHTNLYWSHQSVRGRTAMTSTLQPGDHLVELARGMRELVVAQAGESERLRTIAPAVVDEMWASGLMQSFNPVAAGVRSRRSPR